MDNANEAAYDWLYLEISEDGDLPPVSDLHDIDLQEGEEVRNIAVNIRFTEGCDTPGRKTRDFHPCEPKAL